MEKKIEKPDRKYDVEKTYGIRGMMDFELELPTGSPTVPYIKVHFKDGQISGYGIAPARYTTDDPIVMELIEGTVWYKNKRITVLRERKLKRR